MTVYMRVIGGATWSAAMGDDGVRSDDAALLVVHAGSRIGARVGCRNGYGTMIA